MPATSVTAELITLLTVFIIAGGVGVFVAKVGRFPYTIALLIAGFVVSLAGIEIGIELSHDVILLVLLPPLLFEGAATTNFEVMRENWVPIVVLAVPGLIVSVLALGVLGHLVFGFPILIATLFGAIVLPTDPVSVLALFDELGVTERLSVIVEGESLINDGVGVVLYTALLGLLSQSVGSGVVLAEVLTIGTVVSVFREIVIASVGGLLVGLAAGYSIYSVMINLDERMTEMVLTFVLAYGSFLLAEHFLHVSGVIATVAAGLFIGNRGAEHAMSPQTKISVFTTWETAAFVVNTVIFLLIGVKTPVAQLIDYAWLIALAVVLVIAVRALMIYPAMALLNRAIRREIPLDHQHVMVWGGLHASIPIALVLGLPLDIQFRPELRAMVFGVAAFSLVVQGLSMNRLIRALDVATRTEAERLYELLVGRARAVDEALDAAERLYERNRIPQTVYEDFEAEYGREKDDLNRAIAALLDDHTEIRRKELLVGERQVLEREKSALLDAVRQGIVSDDVGQRLIDEVDVKISSVDDGETTVTRRAEAAEEGGAYEEFWREEAREFGLESAFADEESPGGDGDEGDEKGDEDAADGGGDEQDRAGDEADGK